MATQKPDLTRIWASLAPPANIQDPDDVEPGKFEEGWEAEIPPFEYFNFLQQLFTQGLAHFNEQGFGVWDFDSVYPVGGLAKGSEGWIYECVQENSGVDPTLGDEAFWIIYYKGYEDLQGAAFPSGTRMVFHQNAAPVNWTQVTLGNDFMLRAVDPDGGLAGGADNPVLNDKVPSHTHTTAVDGQHEHGTFRGMDNQTAGIHQFEVGSNESNQGTFGDSTHSHAVLANPGASNWQPRYTNVIICTKD